VALADHETWQSDLANKYKKQNMELDMAWNRLQHGTRQYELVKKLLADAIADSEIMA